MAQSGGDPRRGEPRGGRPARDGRAGKPGRDGRASKPGRDGRASKPGRDGRASKPAAGSRASKPAAGSRDTKPRAEGVSQGQVSRREDRDKSKDRSRSTAGRWRRDDLPAVERSAIQAQYDGPPIPDDITGKELDRAVTNQLKSLPEKLAVRVARHLVAAARLMDSDPAAAYQHTIAARARAARVAIVREASGEAAYAAGNFKDALAEFKAARRMGASPIYLPMMADCERALGRPERAVALAKDPSVVDLDEAGQIEMRIVESGARRDLGDPAAAVRSLESRELRSNSRAAWSARLRYAYADALLANGQPDEAREWFERAAGVDSEGYTDAAERLAELEGLMVIDTVEPDGDDDQNGPRHRRD